jgi:hypothetical protein
MLRVSVIHTWKGSPAAWVTQTKHQKKRNQHKVTLLETDSNVHLPTESNQLPALPKADKWPLAQTKEARLQVVVALWRKNNKVVVPIKKTQNCI